MMRISISKQSGNQSIDGQERLPQMGVSLQSSDVDVGVHDVQQRGQLSDDRFLLRQTDLRHGDHQLQLHLLVFARFCWDKATKHSGQDTDTETETDNVVPSHQGGPPP